MQHMEQGSPLWWLTKLEPKLQAQRASFEVLENYYEGDHALPDVPPRATEAFRRLLKKSRMNWTGLVIEAVEERLHIDGFRFDDPRIDDLASGWWHDTGLAAESEQAHRTALTCARSAVTVWRGPGQVPSITVEHPSQVYVATDMSNSMRRLAAIKIWADEWGEYEFATVYLPDRIERFQRRLASVNGSSIRILGPDGRMFLHTWAPRENVAEQALANPLGVVPVVPIRNRRTMRRSPDGRSEIADVLDVQDRINMTIFNRMMAAEFSAFRQKWVVGLELEEDDDGNLKQPFDVAVDKMLVAEDAGAKFGEFGESSLTGYISSVEADIQHLAAVTRTPPHYLLGQSGAFPSGESLQSTETGLVAKVQNRQVEYGAAWAEVMALARQAQGAGAGPRPHVQWRDPQSRTEAEHIDATLKLKALNVPDEILWERAGFTPEQIERIKQLQAAAPSADPLPVDAPTAETVAASAF